MRTLLLILLLASVSAQAEPRGQTLYAQHCASCHGEDGRGNGALSPRLKRQYQLAPTDFTSTAWQKTRTDEELRKIIHSGGLPSYRCLLMPAWTSLFKPEEVDELVAVLRGFSEPKGLGRALYSTYCLACHGPKGAGDGIEVMRAGIRGKKMSRPRDLRKLADPKVPADIPRHSGIVEGAPGWWSTPLSAGERRALDDFLRELKTQGE